MPTTKRITYDKSLTHLSITARLDDGSSFTYSGKPDRASFDLILNRLDFTGEWPTRLPEAQSDLVFEGVIRDVNALFQMPQSWPRRVLAWFKAFPTS